MSSKLHAVYDLKQCRPVFTVIFMSVVELAVEHSNSGKKV